MGPDQGPIAALALDGVGLSGLVLQVVDGEKRVVEKLLSRRKLKRSYEYEVQWVGLHSDKNTWVPRDKCALQHHNRCRTALVLTSRPSPL